jgi:hypothetical protein
MKINELKFMCPLSIMSKTSTTFPLYPETENVSVTIQFYNMPLGEVDEELQKKIDDAKDDATNTLMKIIGWLDKIMYWGGLICKAINIWHNLVAMFQAVTALVGHAEKLATPTVAKPGLQAARTALCGGTETAREGGKKLYNFGTKFCAFINCKMGPLPKDEEKKGMGKWLNTLGGGGGMSNVIQTKYPGAKIISNYFGKSPSDYLNVKDSMVLSLVTFCIPGIIYNLNKYRQIQCMYAYCLQEYVKAGLPISVCEDQKH